MKDFWKKTVYQIYPKSFCDTNGDGIGDLPGITSKLDYLENLGVDYIWITPFFPSPQNDNGYDVADYTAVDPLFGTMDDLDELIQKADEHGIGLMFDMVFNHTSTEHEWFKKALAGDEKYQNYYIFRDGEPDTPPTNWESKFGGNAWEYVPHLKKWYLHLFDVTQADVNWDNPELREELKNVIRFWKKKGVKGFRFDVVNLISKPEVFENDYEGDGRRFYTDGPHIHEYLHELVHDTGIADMVTVGEMSSTALEHCIRYSNPENEELAMTFSFHHLKVDYKDGDKWELQNADLMKLKNLFETWQTGMSDGNGWNALFWDNHDQPRAISRFGSDTTYWKESGKMLAAAIHFMRGTPYVYQGDELGICNAHFTEIGQYVDVESINYHDILLKRGHSEEETMHIIAERSRDNGRTPMQWDASENAGFTEPGVKSWVPLPDFKREANAAAEVQDEDSIFSFYKNVIALRKEKPVIAAGDIRFLLQEDASVLAYTRTMDGKKSLYVYCNLTEEEHSCSLSPAVQKDGASVLVNNYADADCTENTLTLKPFQAVVFEV